MANTKRSPRADMYIADRESGMTYTEIAEKYGVSRQAIHQVCAKRSIDRFKKITPERCIYPFVREWMNANKISVSEICRRLGWKSYPSAHRMVDRYLRGRIYPKKETIDKLLGVTGLTYEQFFEEDE